jgi:hypothetical protein
MQKIIYFRFANLIIAVANKDLPFLFEPDVNYAQFIVESASGIKPDLMINVHLQDFILDNAAVEMPTFPNNSWSLYKKQNSFFIIPKVRKRGISTWVIAFDHTFQKVNIYYGQDNVVTLTDDSRAIKNIFRRPLDQIILIHYLFTQQAALLHAASVKIGDHGYIFPGVSGAGKSTLTKLFLSRGIISWLSDERTIVRDHHDHFAVYGTPWPSAAKMISNESARLRAIFFIEKGSEPTIKALAPKSAVLRLFNIASIPWYDNNLTQRAFSIFEELVARVPAYLFSYRPNQEAVCVFQKFIATELGK